MIANYRNCKELLRKNFGRENNINRLLMEKVMLIDSYNYTFRHEDFATTKESLKRGFIMPMEDVGATGFTAKDPFMTLNIPTAIKSIDNRLDYLYLVNDLFDEQVKFLKYVKEQKGDLKHAEDVKKDYDKEDKVMTLEEFGRKVSAELANIMFNLGYSHMVYFEQDNFKDYKEEMKNILAEDKDINEVVEKLSMTYDEVIELIENARENLEPIETNEPMLKVKDFYCKFTNKIDKKSELFDDRNQIDIYIKQGKNFKKVTDLFINKEKNIVEIKQLLKDFLCGEVGRILEDGSVQKEYCGQGWFYKNFENFYKREGICYVAEFDNGKIPKVGVSFKDICKEVKDYLKTCEVDLKKLPDGTIERLAEDVFVTVDWQHTSSLIEGDEFLQGYIQDFPEVYFIDSNDKEIESE